MSSKQEITHSIAKPMPPKDAYTLLRNFPAILALSTAYITNITNLETRLEPNLTLKKLDLSSYSDLTADDLRVLFKVFPAIDQLALYANPVIAPWLHQNLTCIPLSIRYLYYDGDDQDLFMKIVAYLGRSLVFFHHLKRYSTAAFRRLLDCTPNLESFTLHLQSFDALADREISRIILLLRSIDIILDYHSGISYDKSSQRLNIRFLPGALDLPEDFIRKVIETHCSEISKLAMETIDSHLTKEFVKILPKRISDFEYTGSCDDFKAILVQLHDTTLQSVYLNTSDGSQLFQSFDVSIIISMII